MLLWDLTIVCFPRDKGTCHCLECIIKGLVVQENPVVVVISVETILNLANRPGDLPNIRVPCKCYESGVDPLSWCRR